MSQSHLRKNSKTPSFYIDIEKQHDSPSNRSDDESSISEELYNGEEDDDDLSLKFNKQKRESINIVLSIILTFLLIATFINLFIFKVNYKSIEAVDKQQQSSINNEIIQNELSKISITNTVDVVDSDVGLLKTLWNSIKLSNSFKPTTSTEFNLYDVNSISINRIDSDELWKLDQYNEIKKTEESKSQKHLMEQDDLDEIKDNEQDLNDVEYKIDPKQDLKEILSISPITILINNNKDTKNNINPNDDNEKPNAEYTKQLEFLKILQNSLTITPEPKVVNLIKHPHYHEILNYLKTYKQHEIQSVQKISAPVPTSIKHDIKYNSKKSIIDDEVENVDEDNEIEDYESGNDDYNDIPRLFIGGLPVADYNLIIEKYNNGELIDFLRDQGKGLISIV